MSKHRISIVGGGIAGLATAYRLTQLGDFEITVYQMGWRLGGKCATGRSPGVERRVEEHGIHLFGGGYYNAIPLMRDVYAALGRDFKAAFERQFASLHFGARRQLPVKRCTPLPASPIGFEDVRAADSVADLLAGMLGNIRSLFTQMLADPLHSGQGGHTFDALFPPVGGWLSQIAMPPGVPPSELGAGGVARLAGELFDALIGAVRQDTAKALTLLGRLRGILDFMSAQTGLFHRVLGGSLRELLDVGDYAVALTQGIVQDMLIGGKSFATLDDLSYETWLLDHGLHRQTLDAPIALAPARILYQWPGGDNDPAARPSMGAGGHAHWALRTWCYCESPFWFFAKGTGETLVEPLYEALRRRGVRFEFFHRATAIGLDAQREGVDSVTFNVQATLRSAPYQPLRDGCWPDRPDYGQLVQEDALRQLPPDELESYWSGWTAGTRTIRRGVDFDTLVYAASLATVPVLCRDLIQASPAWAAMVAGIPTVETQSLQLWMSRSSKDLGFETGLVGPPVGRTDPDDTGLGCGYATPYDGLSDFTPLVRTAERWPAERTPKSLWYFSDVMTDSPQHVPLDDAGYPARRTAEALSAARRFVDGELQRLLPHTQHGGRFDDGLLVAPAGATTAPGTDPLAEQLVRVNFQPSERYVQAPAGSTRFRLDPHDSRFAHLVLAGDWTYNGLNVGCVEATVMSALMAANAIAGKRPEDGIVAWFGR